MPLELHPRALGVLECPDAQVSDQGAYSCEAINSKGSCFAGSPGCGQPGQVSKDNLYFLHPSVVHVTPKCFLIGHQTRL